VRVAPNVTLEVKQTAKAGKRGHGNGCNFGTDACKKSHVFRQAVDRAVKKLNCGSVNAGWGYYTDGAVHKFCVSLANKVPEEMRAAFCDKIDEQQFDTLFQNRVREVRQAMDEAARRAGESGTPPAKVACAFQPPPGGGKEWAYANV
jgi:hypothetical protein